MSVTFSLPRSTRQTDFVATANQTVFGPTSGYLIFDVTDVLVQTKLNASSPWITATPTVTLSATPGFATATFATGLTAGTLVRIQVRRVHPRTTDVTRAGALVSALIERELDLQASVLQELRRDIDVSGNVATLYDLFDNRYLGEKTSLPTLDNDGNALLNGALVSLTGQTPSTLNGMYVRRLGAWQSVLSPFQGSFVSYRYVATASQTVFSGADANGVTLSYVPNAVIVTANGVTLNPNTYTATNGTSIVLGTARTAGDIVVIYSFGTFAVADTWTKAEADGRYPAVANVWTKAEADTRYLTGSPAYLRKRRTFEALGISDGLGANQATAIASALAALSFGDYVDGQNRTYRIDTATAVPSGLVMENVTFDTTQSAANIYPLQLTGTLGAGTAVSTALIKGTYQITVGSTAGYARGDDIFFIRTGYSAGAGFGTDNLSDTWWSTVDTVVNSNTLTLRDAYPHNWSMPVSPGTLTMYRPTLMRDNRFVNVSCLRTGTPTDNTHFFRADYFRGLRWDGGSIIGPRESGMALIAGRDWRIRNLRTLGQNQEGLGYPIVPVNGNEDFWIENCVFEDCRHGVSVGGTGGIDRNGFILGNIVRGARSAGIDVHPNADAITIDGNKIYLANKERDIQTLGQWGNHEGLTYQGANGRITNNEIYGLSGANTAVNERPGIFIQALTRQPEDTFVCNGNRMTNITGAGVIGIFIQNAKAAGDIQSLDVSRNHIHITDFGSTGALSPLGISIESVAGGTEFYNVNLDGNNIRSRSTALRFVIGSTRYMRGVTIMGGNYEVINTDVPVIFLNAGASNRIERVSISGVNLFGGNYSISNTNAGRVTWSGGTAGAFATAATLGTITQPAGAANEIRT